jgi:hypothetical protein
MTVQIDQNRDPHFLGQLTLLGVAIIVLLVYAWTYVD